MNNPIEEELLDKFTHEMLDCVEKNLENGESISEVLSTILSVNISCAFRIMLFITYDVPKLHREVKKFIDNVSTCILEQDITKKIETNCLD
jgi:hypothetical protein